MNKQVLKTVIGEKQQNYHGIIITWDTERTITYSGKTIEVVPVWKWLLSSKKGTYC